MSQLEQPWRSKGRLSASSCSEQCEGARTLNVRLRVQNTFSLTSFGSGVKGSSKGRSVALNWILLTTSKISVRFTSRLLVRCDSSG
jgi:hypothetical protein